MGVEAKRGGVFARQLNEIRAAGGALHRDALDLSGRVLDPDDAGQLRQLAHGFGRHVHDRAAGDVVDDDGKRAAVMQRGVMRDHACLRGLVVIGRDDEGGIGADAFGVLDQADAFDGVVRPRACDDRHAPCGEFHDRFDDGFMFFVAERRAFACGADGDKAGGAAFDLPIDKFLQRVQIKFAVLERRYQGGNGPLDHGTRLLFWAWPPGCKRALPSRVAKPCQVGLPLTCLWVAGGGGVGQSLP
jgi:hypothetical protein